MIAAVTLIAIDRLYDAVVQGFKDDGCGTPNDFGWRAPSYQTREIASRICWVPGDATNGNAGEIGPPYKPGRAPERPIASFFEFFTVFCYACNQAEDLTDERAHFSEVSRLWRYFYKRLHKAAYEIEIDKRYALRRADWVNDKKERPHGATMRLLFSIQDDIPDDAMTFAPMPVTGIFATGLAQFDAETGETPITTSDGSVEIEPEEDP